MAVASATFSVVTKDHVFVYVRGRLVMKTYRGGYQSARVFYEGYL